MSTTLSELAAHDLTRARFSPRHFDPRPVPPEVLRVLFEAARWAPSCFNDQPWSFVYAQKGTEGFDRLAQSMVPKNAEWAREAPVLVLAVSRLTFAHNGKPNRFAQYDTGQSVAWLTMEATARGLSVHQMGGFDPAKAAEAVSLPDGWEAMTLFVIGYSSEPPSDSRSRKALSSILYEDRFGQTAG
jgi:nitroreductase